MKKLIALLAALAALTIGVQAAAADTGAAATADPFACSFDTDFNATCDNNFVFLDGGAAVAEWSTDQTPPVLTLTKDAPTPAYLVAGATVNGFAGDPLFELGFDVRGYCNNGAPRFNVYVGDQTDFFGCAFGTHTDLGDGWTHVEFGGCHPGDGSNGALCWDEETATPLKIIDGIELIQDESGTTALRNITVNDILIGPPVDSPVVQGSSQREGYCASHPVTRPGQDPGLFLDLLRGQGAIDPAYKNAQLHPAFELAPSGALTCLLPAGYVTTGQVDGEYPIAVKTPVTSSVLSSTPGN